MSRIWYADVHGNFLESMCTQRLITSQIDATGVSPCVMIPDPLALIVSQSLVCDFVGDYIGWVGKLKLHRL